MTDAAPLAFDTSAAVRRVADERRQALAREWNLEAACALLRGSDNEDDVWLCCESMLLDAIDSEFKSVQHAERHTGHQLGTMGVALGPHPELLDQVLCRRVAWVRLLELCWKCDNFFLAELLLQGPLAHHPTTALCGHEFTGPLAHVRVAWRWCVGKRGCIDFAVAPPSAAVPMNNALRNTFFPQSVSQ